MDYPEAEQMTPVGDNRNSHGIASLYEAFDTATVHQTAQRLRLVHTPEGDG